ncbi:hypothetical protein ACVMIX_005919 [Rhizobium leguminosarum]
MQCPTDLVCENGLRPAFNRARQRSNGFVHIENHVPEPLDLIIELIDLDFVEVVTLQQSPHCFDEALSAPNDIKALRMMISNMNVPSLR